MKKFFSILAFVATLAFSMTACTEEEVKPVEEKSNTGGNVSQKGF